MYVFHLRGFISLFSSTNVKNYYKLITDFPTSWLKGTVVVLFETKIQPGKSPG